MNCPCFLSSSIIPLFRQPRHHAEPEMSVSLEGSRFQCRGLAIHNHAILAVPGNHDKLLLPNLERIGKSKSRVRRQGFCKPYDFVLAPIFRDSNLDPESQAEKPILITRFTKHSDEWRSATYYNVRTGKECGVTTGESNDPKVVSVKSYREILHQYPCNLESKFNGPNGEPCGPWTHGILQRRHVSAGVLNYCGKEFKRKLEQGPVDHETDFKVKVYANGRVSADPEVLRALSRFSERETNKGTGLSRRIIRNIRHGVR